MVASNRCIESSRIHHTVRFLFAFASPVGARLPQSQVLMVPSGVFAAPLTPTYPTMLAGGNKQGIVPCHCQADTTLYETAL